MSTLRIEKETAIKDIATTIHDWPEDRLRTFVNQMITPSLEEMSNEEVENIYTNIFFEELDNNGYENIEIQ